MDSRAPVVTPLTSTENTEESRLVHYINLKLELLGLPTVPVPAAGELRDLASLLLQHQRATDRLVANYLCPADWRVQRFLDEYLYGVANDLRLPTRTFTLDRPGLARVLSLPPGQDFFVSDIVSTYRVKQGILHNPKSDRRTTQGSFHIAEGGAPIPDDKVAVKRHVFGELLRHAVNPPANLMRLPFTATQRQPAECFVSLLLRPTVCPAVPGWTTEKSMEIRFFAPGNLVGNLDFVETIFGNGGDPFLPENDAGLDVEHWSGHTGAVILAPHLVHVTKKSLGLPSWEQASERERRDGQCWRQPDECYNGGHAFKLTARDERGVMVTIIADNYFGYCKKEVKTQMSFATNLFGGCEEEHAGGARVYPSYDLGEEFSGDLHVRSKGHTLAEATALYGAVMDVQPEGYAIDKNYPTILYVPEDARFDLHTQKVSWEQDGALRQIKLLPGQTYVRPSGYKVQMEKPPGYNRAWRLVGSVAEGTLCHKPSTVSGGGKSEISKPIADAILTGPVFVADFSKDFDAVAELIGRDYSNRFKDPARQDTRPVLSSDRSLGSVIKLLTPDEREFRPEYNAELERIPQYIKELVFVVKRYYKPTWGKDWRCHFSVDVINGIPGNELKCDSRKLVTTYLRVGFEPDGSWRTFGCRKDFHPAVKIQMEDDITASVVVPTSALKHLNPDYAQPAVKFVKNAESRLFQRPDDAIHRGYDKQTENDFTQPGNFLSNYEPLTAAQARDLVEDTVQFDAYTEPMQRFIREVAETGRPTYFVSSAHPRVIGGQPSKNPRYLQIRPDLARPREVYLTEMATRLYRRIPPHEPLHTPVNAVLPGRRNNPPETGLRSLAVYNPIHYMPLPELFMEFISSMTGKSPSTTGAGSEGALTKGPFNALLPIIDLNNALVAYLLTESEGFVTAAGYIGPRCRVDHDISLLVPELWCRLSVEERDPRRLIEQGYLEPCEDFQHAGKTVSASRLGYRITAKFVRAYFGRIFNHPHLVFTDAMLRPETQDLGVFVDGIDNIVSTHRRVAEMYFRDGGVELACPPLRALLHIMRDGAFQGLTLRDSALRSLFTREQMLSSDWYAARLLAQQTLDLRLWQRHLDYLENFLSKANYADEALRLNLADRLRRATQRYQRVKSPDYLRHLHGSLGAQPLNAAAPRAGVEFEHGYRVTRSES